MRKSRCLLCVLVCFLTVSISACGNNQDVQHEQGATKMKQDKQKKS